MYDLTDTIVAVSSAAAGVRSIIRMTGPQTLSFCRQVFGSTELAEVRAAITLKRNGIIAGYVVVDEGLSVEAKLYLFFAPHSYTGETLAEMHIQAPDIVVEAVVRDLLARGLRMAGPGEFSARAYLNGKLDLAQAEAVNEIVVSSNKFQLAAAQRLLSGRLGQTLANARSALVDCLSLIEAGLDFSGEDIELVSRPKAVDMLAGIKAQLEQLLSDSIGCEMLIGMPAVGIAGVPNAGKSSLLNKLLGAERSIVSDQPKTTRDVLTGLLTLEHCRCVLFDCAGLVIAPENISFDPAQDRLDELAQQAAMEALRNSSAVIFCVDVSKTDWGEDKSIRELIESESLIPVATKCDLVPQAALAERIGELNGLFGVEFLPVSVRTGVGLGRLRDVIDRKLIGPVRREAGLSENAHDTVALTARHRQAVTAAIEDIGQAVDELKASNDELAAMMIRAAYQAICDIEHQPIDEQVLDRIFSRFCIGK